MAVKLSRRYGMVSILLMAICVAIVITMLVLRTLQVP